MKASTGRKLGVKVCDVEDLKAVMLQQGQLCWLLKPNEHLVTQIASVKLPSLCTAKHLHCSTWDR